MELALHEQNAGGEGTKKKRDILHNILDPFFGWSAHPPNKLISNWNVRARDKACTAEWVVSVAPHNFAHEL